MKKPTNYRRRESCSKYPGLDSTKCESTSREGIRRRLGREARPEQLKHARKLYRQLSALSTKGGVLQGVIDRRQRLAADPGWRLARHRKRPLSPAKANPGPASANRIDAKAPQTPSAHRRNHPKCQTTGPYPKRAKARRARPTFSSGLTALKILASMDQVLGEMEARR